MILQACSKCDRQYDVTNVLPGRRVRCICDQVLEVSHRSPLAVEALQCAHCGGAVGRDDPACPFCGAKLSELDRRASTLCPKCYARMPDDAKHCPGCGIEIRPQALTPLPEDRACPRCKGTLQHRALGISTVIECSVCGGLWLEARVFEAVVRDTERELDGFLSSLHAPAERPRTLDRQGYIPCLTCGELMLRRQFRHRSRASGVVVDTCRGHGLWLDHEELEHIVSFLRTGAAPSDVRAEKDGLDPFLTTSRPGARTTHVLTSRKREGVTMFDVLEFLVDMLTSSI
ncbi:MAG: zinc ribbon domain-containing protein [Planctomycetota bacterium]|nr:zinc ribbon domain-containing protein [Planctomycetota bacterium]